MEENDKGKYMNKIRNSIVLFTFLTICFFISILIYTSNGQETVITAREFMNPEKMQVRLLGRYSFKEDDIVWFDYTLSGLEFSFTGRKCIAHFTSDFLADDEKHAIVGIFINNSESEAMRLEINQNFCDYTVFESVTDRTVVIKIVKLSEAKQGTVGITGITVRGKKPVLEKTQDKDGLIQFVGDSITCGMGNETIFGEEFTTFKENGNMTYGAITARNLDADVEFVAYSGIGLIWGTSDDIPPMTQMYQYSGYTRGKRKADNWSTARKPDAICINLGTNDAKYIKNSREVVLFKKTYVDFLKGIRMNNPEAYMVICCGPMNYDLKEVIEETVLQYQMDTGDDRCGYLVFDESLKEGSGCGGHPTVKTHENMATVLTEYLEQRL